MGTGAWTRLRIASWRVTTTALATVGAALAVSAPAASAYVYWTDGGAGNASDGTTIARADLDGSGVIPGLVSGAAGPTGIAVDGTHIYWANTQTNAIGRANLDGSGANPAFIPNATSGGGSTLPLGVAVDAGHIYWTDQTRYIGRANIDGSSPQPHFIDLGSLSFPFGIAVDGSWIYVVTSVDTIKRAPIGGGSASTFITLSSGSSPYGLAVAGGYIFWTQLNFGKTPTTAPAVGRAPIGGSPVDETLITGLGFPTGVASDGNTLFWVDHQTNTIGEAQLGSSGAFNVHPLFASDAGGPIGVAFDSRIDPTSTSVACSPASAVPPGSDTVCKATVSDSASTTTPTGSIVFSTTSLDATFALGNTCTLTASPGGGASCTVGVAAVSAGTAQIDAAYGGDALHQASSGSSSICIGTSAQCGGTTTATTTTTTPTTTTTTTTSNTPPPPAPKCKVPKTAGKSLKTAEAAIKKAGCKIGKITKPRARRGVKLRALIVKRTSPAAGKTVAKGAKVAILLVQRPKPRK